MDCKMIMYKWLCGVWLEAKVGCSAKEGDGVRVFCQCGSGY